MSWKFKQIKPQKARGKYHEGLWTDPQWLAEEKYDGERRIAQFCGSIVRFTGCRESVDGTGYVEKSKQVPHLSNMGPVGVWKTPNVAKLDGTVLDGEFVPPPGTKIQGGGSKYVTSIMGSSPEEALRKQKERGFLCYKVFDCLWFKGNDLRDHNLAWRRESANKAVALWNNSYASLSKSYGGEKAKRALYESAAEGVVFKNLDHKYGDEKLWVKHKKAWTADVVVMGFTEGKGKYKGQIGAIRYGQWMKYEQYIKHGPHASFLPKTPALQYLGQCSGMPDGERLCLTRNGDQYVSAVLEITHNGREPSGKFRHPQFSRWRLDKSPKDCVYDPEET